MIKYILLYFVILFSGDNVMFNLGGFSNLGYLNIFALGFVSVLANLTSDIIFFLTGNKLLNKLKFKELESKKKKIRKFLKGKEVLSIFLSKFIYGTRTLTVVVLGELKVIKLSKYIFYDALALIIITSIILSLGYFSYEYFNLIFIKDSLIKAVFIVFLVIIGYLGFILWKKKSAQ